jgi:hypothetical protein
MEEAAVRGTKRLFRTSKSQAGKIALWRRERPERESYFRMKRRSIAAAESRGAHRIGLRRTRKLRAQLDERRAGTG